MECPLKPLQDHEDEEEEPERARRKQDQQKMAVKDRVRMGLPHENAVLEQWSKQSEVADAMEVSTWRRNTVESKKEGRAAADAAWRERVVAALLLSLLVRGSRELSAKRAISREQAVSQFERRSARAFGPTGSAGNLDSQD